MTTKQPVSGMIAYSQGCDGMDTVTISCEDVDFDGVLVDNVQNGKLKRLFGFLRPAPIYSGVLVRSELVSLQTGNIVNSALRSISAQQLALIREIPHCYGAF
jgi:hypothetical protein